MNAIFGSDLDDTLIYRIDSADHHDVIITEWTRKGVPLGMTRAAWHMLGELNRDGAFVPVTARSAAAFRRASFPSGTPEWAVIAAGGVLLHWGLPDAHWQSITRKAAAGSTPADRMRDLLSGADGLARPRTVEGFYVLAEIEDHRRFMDSHERVRRAAADGGWGISVQHDKVHLFPLHTSKGTAFAELAQRLGAECLVTAGDSVMDIPLLRVADYALRPGSGELHSLGWSAPGVEQVAQTGAPAGEAILRRAQEHLTRHSRLLLDSPRPSGKG